MSPVNPYESPAEVSAPQLAATRASAPGEAPFRPAQLLTRILLGIYIAAMALEFVAIVEREVSRHFVLRIKHFTVLSDPSGTEDARVRNLERARQGLRLSEMVQLVHLLGGVGLQSVRSLVFLVWLYTVNANLPALGFERIYRPGMAVLAMLVPCVNVFLSFPVMHELALGSDPKRFHPNSYRGPGFSWLVISWWAAMVISLISSLALMASMAEHHEPFTEPIVMRSQSIVSAIGLIPSALAYVLIRNIWRDQQLRRELVLSNSPPLT